MDITRFFVSQRNKSLLVGDYGSYRKHLSKRLLTVRRKLGRTTPKGRKYVAKAPITVEDISSNHEFAHFLILTAERAWAHAMYMKSMHSADSAAKPITRSTRKHILSRLHKAEETAAHLTELIEGLKGASTQTVLEAGAYHSTLLGFVDFESQKWEKCLEAFSEAHLIYSTLITSIESNKGDVLRDLLSSTIDPSIRYAAYQLRLPRSLSIDAIVSRFLSKDSAQVRRVLETDPDALAITGRGPKKGFSQETGDLPQTITWRSRNVKLEDATIAQSLATVTSAEQVLRTQLSKLGMTRQDKASAYDKVLIPSQDAVDAAKTAIDELTADGTAQSDHRMQALQITRTAVNYALVGWRIGRNRVLCGEGDGAILEPETLKKPRKPRIDHKEWVVKGESNGRQLARLQERVVLYDATMQSINSVKGLPGVAADQSFLQELESRKSYFAALRCLAIARSHALLGRKKNALALLARASTQASNASSGVPCPASQVEKSPNLDVTDEQIHSLQHLLRGLVMQYRALVELDTINANADQVGKSNSSSEPLIERLDEYPSSWVDLTNLVTYPPRLKAIPVKPLFLDAAWNYIDYPGQGKKDPRSKSNGIAENTKKQADAKVEGKKGWFSFGR